MLRTLHLQAREAPAFSVRVALGALIIKEKLQLSDEEAVLHIDFFFKGWKQVALHVYVDAGKFAHSSSFV